MSSRIPPFSALRAFEALARLERVTAVAKELNLTHGAISHQIKSLEDMMGVPLFHRETRAMRLTEAGRTYAYQVRQILDELGQIFKKNTLPFGGMQVIFTGDFFQLPPVTKGDDTVKFAFESESWLTAVTSSVELTIIHRQKD